MLSEVMARTFLDMVEMSVKLLDQKLFMEF